MDPASARLILEKRFPYLWAIVMLFAGPIVWGLVVAFSLYVLRPFMMTPGYDEAWHVGTAWIALSAGGLATPIGIVVGIAMAVGTFNERRNAKKHA